jgi:hypothetical protein
MRFSLKKALKTVGRALRIRTSTGDSDLECSQYLKGVERQARSTFPDVSKGTIQWMVEESKSSYERAVIAGKPSWYKYLRLDKIYPNWIVYIGLDLDVVSVWNTLTEKRSMFVPREEFTLSMYRDYITCVLKIRKEVEVEPALPQHILEAEGAASCSSPLGEMVVEMVRIYSASGCAKDPFDDAFAIEGSDGDQEER